MNKFLVLSAIAITLIGCTQKSTQTENNPANDSVQKYLALAENDSLDFNLRVKYNDKALSFIDLRRNDSLTREVLGRTSKNFLIIGENDKFLEISKKLHRKIIKNNDSLRLAQYYENRGVYFNKLRINDSAFSYFLKSERIFLKNKNYEKLGKILIKKSITQLKLDDYLGAELSAKKAFKFLEKSNSKRNRIFSLMALGTCYQNMKEYDKAIKTFNYAMTLSKKQGNDLSKNNFLIETCLNNIGNAYREQKKYNKAIHYFKVALKERRIEKGDPELYACLLNNLNFCYLENEKKNYGILHGFKKAKRIFDSLNIKNESAVSDLYLSEYYLKQNDSLKANQHAEFALKSSKEANAPYYYLTALSHAGSINPKKAPLYIQEFKRINDSLLFEERTARNQYFKIQLETEEINQQKETALRQRTLFLIITIAVFFIAILVFIIARQRLKQKELRLQHTRQKANEEIYQLMLVQKTKEDEARLQEKKRIAMELHDGVMNKLTSTRLNLSLLSFKKDSKTIEHCLPHIEEIKAIENEIRNLTHNLNEKTILGENSYEKLLTDLTIELNQISNLNFELVIDTAVNWEQTNDIQKMNLYRILQEACQNINKHSEAHKANIHFFLDGEKLCLTITDDGIGIQPNNPKKGIGLKNIKYRVKELKGKLNINSKANQGTTLSIAIPLEN